MKAQPPSEPLIKVAILICSIVLIFWVASFFPDLILAFIISGLAAFVISPVVTFLEGRMGMRRVPAIATAFVTLGGALVFVLVKIIPYLFGRFRAIYEQLRSFPFDAKLAELTGSLHNALPFIDGVAVAKSIQSFIEEGINRAGSSVENSLGTIATLTIVPFVTYFMPSDGHRAFTFLIERVPNRYFEMTLNVYHKIRSHLVGYLKGWILDSMIVGMLSITGLTILGIQYSVVIGLVAGVANLVPYLGPIVAASLAILVSLTQAGNFSMVIPIIIVTLIIRFLDDFVVQPLCFARSVHMHPLTVILLLIIGHEALGVGGMLLAIPLATILKVSAVETYWGLRNYRITA